MKLKDIAAEVGVSVSIVSRVLNHPETNVASKEVRERIWKIVHANGYIPNRAAQTLKNGCEQDKTVSSNKFLSCLIATSPEERKDGIFYNRLINGIEREAFLHNYFLQSTFSSIDMDDTDTIKRLQESQTHNLIILGRFRPQLYHRLRKYYKNIVYTGMNTIDISCDQVICDGYQISYDIVHYLNKNGHQKIAFIGLPHDARLHGYYDAMRKLRLTIRSEHVINPLLPSMSDGYKAMNKILRFEDKPTALCCASDNLAIGALRSCKEHGINVPMDISIMGMIDLEAVQYVSPMLSSVQVPLEEMGKMATKLLLDRINGGHRYPVKCYLPYTIIKRESIAHLR